MAVVDFIQKDDTPRLTRLGKIRLGEKATKTVTRDGKKVDIEYPVATEHFVMRDALDFPCQGAAPKTLYIIFPFPEEQSVEQWYRLYGSSASLKCRGDGQYIDYHIDEQGIVRVQNGVALRGYPEVREVPGGAKEQFHVKHGDRVACPGMSGIGDTPDAPHYTRCKDCKLSANLRFIPADLDRARFGYYQIDTGSKHGLLNILGALQHARQAFGTMVGIPFYLSLVPTEITFWRKGKDGKREPIRVTKPILQLEAAPAFFRARMRQLMEAKLAQLQATLAILPSGEGDTSPPPDLAPPSDTMIDGVYEAETVEELPDLYDHNDAPISVGADDNKSWRANASALITGLVSTIREHGEEPDLPDMTVELSDYLDTEPRPKVEALYTRLNRQAEKLKAKGDAIQGKLV